MSSPPYRHPELDYLCPSPSFLRKTGITLALIAFGVIGGALVLRAGHVTRISGTAPSVQTTAVADTATATTTAERPRPPEGSKQACEADTWAYLDGRCLAGKARKARSLRAATDGSLGRSTLPKPAASRLPPKLASGVDAAATAPTVVKRIGQSNSALQKARKTAVSQKARKTAVSQNSGHDVRKTNSSLREERGRDDRWSARAYAMPPDRNSPGQYERSWGWSR